MHPIQMTIFYPGGGSLAAVLLGVSGNIMRLAVDGWGDVGVFRLIEGQWFSEDGEPVDIDSMPDVRLAEEALCGWFVGECRPALPALIWVN